MQRVISKVNAVEALLDEQYFIRAIIRCLSLSCAGVSLDQKRKQLPPTKTPVHRRAFNWFQSCCTCSCESPRSDERAETRESLWVTEVV